MTECPECGGAVAIQKNCEKGEIVQCKECGVELEVKETKPLKMELAPKVEEDWGE